MDEKEEKLSAAKLEIDSLQQELLASLSSQKSLECTELQLKLDKKEESLSAAKQEIERLQQELQASFTRNKMLDIPLVDSDQVVAKLEASLKAVEKEQYISVQKVTDLSIQLATTKARLDCMSEAVYGDAKGGWRRMQQLEDTVAEQEAIILMLRHSVSVSSIIPPNSISPSKSDVSSNMTLDTTNTTIPDDSTWINDDLGQLSRADYEKVILETLLNKI